MNKPGIAAGNTGLPPVIERIETLLKSSDVFLFMKGTPTQPQCGFSSKICNILMQYDGLEYKYFNIFDD